MENFKSYLANKFGMTDLKEIKFFLGLKIERVDVRLSFSQSSYLYIKNVILKFIMEHCNPLNSPLLSKLNHEAFFEAVRNALWLKIIIR